jgi:hypothetical protein
MIELHWIFLRPKNLHFFFLFVTLVVISKQILISGRHDVLTQLKNPGSKTKTNPSWKTI